MTEKTAEVGRGVSLTYEVLGPADGEPVVLIAGLSQQLHSWPDAFCELLAAQGMRVLRFDNRDAGHSTHPRIPAPGARQLLTRRFAAQQYSLYDLAEDTVGLLDAIGWRSGHIVGVSMGGMIGQIVAARYPRAARSLTSIMSTTGAKGIGGPAWSTWVRMATLSTRNEQACLSAAVRMFRHIGSAGYPFDEELVRARAEVEWRRDPDNAAGVARQLGAIFKSGDRTAEAATITAPTLVLHGDHDRMVHPSGGAATAAAIPGAREIVLPGMGHDLPEQLWTRVTDLIGEHVLSAATSPGR